VCKNLLCLLMLVFLISVVAVVEADPNLVVEWRMDETSGTSIPDTSGNSNTGTTSGGPTWVTGLFGNALQFDGTDDCASKTGATGLPLLTTDTWSMNVYLYPTRNLTEWSMIAGFGNYASASTQGRYLYGGTVDGTVAFHGVWQYSDEPWSLNTWQMITVTYDGSNVLLYKNGEELTINNPGALSAQDATYNNIHLAQYLWSSQRFQGKMDEFTIWDGPLEQDQIENLYKYNELTPDPAWSPSPGDEDDWMHYDCSKVTLEWLAGNYADTHDVYFGTVFNDVNDADPNSDEFMGNTEDCYFDVNGMQADTWYYWRVDEVNDGNTWTGNVWRFYTEDDWQKEGWVLTFHDEFDGDGNELDMTKWEIGSPGWAGSPRPMAFLVDDHSVYDMNDSGIIGLVNREQDFNDPDPKSYVSGRIQTKGMFDQAFGWFEARCKMPGYLGDFPAFWLMPYGSTYTPAAEVDIMEHWHREGETVAANLHWDDYGDDHKWAGSGMYSVPGVWDGFHTYAVKWEPGKLDFYVDGTKFWTHAGEEVPSVELFIILNNALDDYEGIDTNDMPTYFEIDYVRVYESPNSVLTYDHFEDDTGNYTIGGGDCSRYTGGSRAYKNSCAMNIQDNSGVSSSFYHTNGIDVNTPGFTQIKVDFSYYAYSMSTGHDFLVEYYDGDDWNTIETYVCGTDFSNGNFYTEAVTIDSSSYNFPTDMKIRFQCSAGNDYDDVYIDEIRVTGIK